MPAGKRSRQLSVMPLDAGTCTGNGSNQNGEHAKGELQSELEYKVSDHVMRHACLCFQCVTFLIMLHSLQCPFSHALLIFFILDPRVKCLSEQLGGERGRGDLYISKNPGGIQLGTQRSVVCLLYDPCQYKLGLLHQEWRTGFYSPSTFFPFTGLSNRLPFVGKVLRNSPFSTKKNILTIKP